MRPALFLIFCFLFSTLAAAHIDIAHHYGLSKKSLYETLALEDAVKEAVDLTDSDETLIIVTADHSHPFSIQGFSYRGNDIFGKCNIPKLY